MVWIGLDRIDGVVYFRNRRKRWTKKPGHDYNFAVGNNNGGIVFDSRYRLVQYDFRFGVRHNIQLENMQWVAVMRRIQRWQNSTHRERERIRVKQHYNSLSFQNKDIRFKCVSLWISIPYLCYTYWNHFESDPSYTTCTLYL